MGRIAASQLAPLGHYTAEFMALYLGDLTLFDEGGSDDAEI
jgi:hypothetical protein